MPEPERCDRCQRPMLRYAWTGRLICYWCWGRAEGWRRQAILSQRERGR